MSLALRFRLCELARPLLRSLPAGRVRVAGWLGAGQKSVGWDRHPAPIKVFRDRRIAAWVQVDLRDWGGRWHYFSGVYYDQTLPWIMRRYLQPGDLFVDVGANFGIHTLTASPSRGPEWARGCGGALTRGFEAIEAPFAVEWDCQR